MLVAEQMAGKPPRFWEHAPREKKQIANPLMMMRDTIVPFGHLEREERERPLSHLPFSISARSPPHVVVVIQRHGGIVNRAHSPRSNQSSHIPKVSFISQPQQASILAPGPFAPEAFARTASSLENPSLPSLPPTPSSQSSVIRHTCNPCPYRIHSSVPSASAPGSIREVGLGWRKTPP